MNSPLFPAKLIIVAPKKLLDEVGTGKISFAQFQEQVSVEYLTFDVKKEEDQKQSEEK